MFISLTLGNAGKAFNSFRPWFQVESNKIKFFSSDEAVPSQVSKSVDFSPGYKTQTLFLFSNIDRILSLSSSISEI